MKMTREKMMEKYLPQMKEFNKLNGTQDDVTVIMDKIIYMNNKKHGRAVTGNDNYLMPENFPYEEFDVDYLEAVKPKEVE